MPAHLHQKMLYAGFTYFFSIFCCKSIDLKAFHAFGRISFRWLVFSFWTFYRKKYWFEVFSSFWSSFLLAAISLKFLVSAVNLSGKSKTPRFRMRPIRFNTCNFCCIYLLNKLNNKNIECRHTSIKRCCTQGLHISFQYFAAKVLIWKLFMLLVESPFAGWFFPFKRFIEKVLIWSVFKLLVFHFAGCLFLEVPSFCGFSGQFERKIQNLEWGPLDLTLAIFAVFTC